MHSRLLFLVLLSSFAINGCGWFKKEPTRPENPLVMGISYVGVSVNNLDATLSLYQDAADLKLVQTTTLTNHDVINQLSEGNPAKVKAALLSSVNAQIRFMEFEQDSVVQQTFPPVAVNGTGIAHVCFQVNRTTNTYQHFLDRGASVIGERDMVQISSRNPVYYAYANDPEGILVEIEEVDVAALELETLPKHNFRLRQISLATPDMDRILAFYSELLEEQHPRRIGKWLSLSGDKIDAISGLPESKLEMAWFQTRNLEIEIVQYHSHPPKSDKAERPLNAHGYNLIMFEVADLSRLKTRLQSVGADIILEHHDLDGLPVLFTRDPDGNLLGFQPSDINNDLSGAKFKNNGI